MMMKMSLVVVMLAATACQAGVLPHLMFPAAGRPGQQQQQPWSIHRPQQQQQQQQPQQQLGDAYANYFERAAALMAASGADLDLSAAAAGVQQPVYGIPHRYLSDPYPAALPAATAVNQMGQQQQINRPDLLATYSGNPLFSSGMSSLYKNNKRSVGSSAGSGYSNYDLMAAMLSADLAAEEQQQQQQAAAAAADYLEDEPIINQQDALNFENYVQRFFQQQQQLYDNDWSDEAAADAFDDESQFDWEVPQQQQQQQQQQLMDNDEEAAQQLHLLLQQVEQQQRSRPALPMNIQKKSIVMTTTVAPLPVATPMTVSSATQQGGQKEEAMLRPPTPAKHQSTTTTTTTTTTSAPQPTYGTKKSSVAKNEDPSKSGKSIYRTIHRLMADSSENKVQSAAPFSLLVSKI